jgi:nitrate reductase gamma subunit
MLLRAFEIYSLGRKPDLSERRGSRLQGGLKIQFTRSLPRPELFRTEPIRIVNGYIIHIGLFIVIFLLGPHIALIDHALSVSWPALPSGIVDAVAVLTLVSLMVALVYRLRNPVMRYLSGPGDYLAWLATLLPVLTGYMAYNHLLLPYTLMLALHILSVEFLLVVAPFTTLTHMFSVFAARWYQGAAAGYRGVAS